MLSREEKSSPRSSRRTQRINVGTDASPSLVFKWILPKISIREERQGALRGNHHNNALENTKPVISFFCVDPSFRVIRVPSKDFFIRILRALRESAVKKPQISIPTNKSLLSRHSYI